MNSYLVMVSSGKALQNEQVVNATYIITDGKDGDGPRNFTFSGSLVNEDGAVTAPTNVVTVTTVEGARKRRKHRICRFYQVLCPSHLRGTIQGSDAS